MSSESFPENSSANFAFDGVTLAHQMGKLPHAAAQRAQYLHAQIQASLAGLGIADLGDLRALIDQKPDTPEVSQALSYLRQLAKVIESGEAPSVDWFDLKQTVTIPTHSLIQEVLGELPDGRLVCNQDIYDKESTLTMSGIVFVDPNTGIHAYPTFKHVTQAMGVTPEGNVVTARGDRFFLWHSASDTSEEIHFGPGFYNPHTSEILGRQVEDDEVDGYDVSRKSYISIALPFQTTHKRVLGATTDGLVICQTRRNTIQAIDRNSHHVVREHPFLDDVYGATKILGSRISVCSAGSVCVWDPRGGKKDQIWGFAEGSSMRVYVVAHPDHGNLVAFTVPSEDDALHVMDLESGRQMAYGQAAGVVHALADGRIAVWRDKQITMFE